jgi:hypothetical protein
MAEDSGECEHGGDVDEDLRMVLKRDEVIVRSFLRGIPAIHAANSNFKNDRVLYRTQIGEDVNMGSCGFARGIAIKSSTWYCATSHSL